MIDVLCKIQTFWTDCTVPIKRRFCALDYLYEHNYLLENSLGRATVLKSDGITNFLSKHDVHFVSHPLSHTHRSHSPGLSTGNRPLRTRLAPHHVHTPLWDLVVEAKFAVYSDKTV